MTLRQAILLLILTASTTVVARADTHCEELFALDEAAGVVYTTDCGHSWFPASPIDGVSAAGMTSVSVDASGKVVVSTDSDGLFASHDGGMTWQRDAPFASLTVRVTDLLNGEAIPAGSPGRFRIVIENGGPDDSTNTTASFAWFRNPITGPAIHANYTMRPSQGQCARSLTPEPACILGTITAGGSVVIDFDGSTEPGRLGIYTLRVWVASDQAAPTLLAEIDKGTSITIAESGGGAAGWLFLGLLALVALGRVNAVRGRSVRRG